MKWVLTIAAVLATAGAIWWLVTLDSTSAQFWRIWIGFGLVLHMFDRIEREWTR